MESEARRLAIILLTFPLTSEQFLLREFRELERQGIRLEIFPLRPKPQSRLPEDAIPLMQRVHHTKMIFSWRLLKANANALIQRPALYAKAFLRALSLTTNPKVLLKHLALFPKTVLIADMVKNMRIRHVHAHWATVPAGAAVIVSSLSGATYSFTGHATDIFAARNRVGLRAKIRGAAFVTSCTQHGQALLQGLCDNDEQRQKIFLCHHGLVAEDYIARGKTMGVPLIASGGRLVEKKGLIHLVRALGLLKGKSVPFEAVFVGGGPLREPLEKAIELHGLKDCTRLTGFISHEDVKVYLSRAALFVAPSIVTRNGEMDGIPNIVLEAMAFGKPVVASAIPPMAEVIKDGINGYLVGQKDERALASAIERLLGDQELCHALGEAGRKKVVVEFDLARNVKTFINIPSQYGALDVRETGSSDARNIS
jgi:colanic acid/amylovoran biosynthesis glycosyltransferase